MVAELAIHLGRHLYIQLRVRKELCFLPSGLSLGWYDPVELEGDKAVVPSLQ